VALYLHSPTTASWRGAQLKHRDNFTFTFKGEKRVLYTVSCVRNRNHPSQGRHGGRETWGQQPWRTSLA